MKARNRGGVANLAHSAFFSHQGVPESAQTQCRFTVKKEHKEQANQGRGNSKEKHEMNPKFSSILD